MIDDACAAAFAELSDVDEGLTTLSEEPYLKNPSAVYQSSAPISVFEGLPNVCSNFDEPLTVTTSSTGPH